jgi:hypothetical protein
MLSEKQRLEEKISHYSRLSNIYWQLLLDTYDVLIRLFEPTGIEAQHAHVLQAWPDQTHWTAIWRFADQNNLHPLLRKAAMAVADNACELNNLAQELHYLEQEK